MDYTERYLQKEAMGYERARVVLGNPTCDLDSAVCALVQGYRLYREELSSSEDKKRAAVFAVMNITEKEFRLKTEVLWVLGKNGITAEELTFRNQIDLRGLARAGKLELTLVDHHALSGGEEEKAAAAELESRVVEIIDHRPRDAIRAWAAEVKITLEPVGSCASLVARSLSSEKPEILDAGICALLRGTILSDTYNLSVEAGRAVALDHEMVARLEISGARLEGGGELSRPRDQVYREILAAKTDISGMTVDDLLAKDLKVVADVAIPVLPILVEELIKREGALESVVSFASAASFGLLLLLGIDFTGERMKRDLGIYAPVARKERLEEMVSRLRESDLEVEEALRSDEDVPGDGLFALFRQRNVRLTRKYVVPIVRNAVVRWEERSIK